MDDILKSLIEGLEQASHDQEKCRINLKLANYYFDHSSLDQAREYAEKAYLLISEETEGETEADILEVYAIINSIQGNNEQAIQQLQRALNINLSGNKESRVMRNYSNLGSCFLGLTQLEEGLNYLFKALDIAEKIKFPGIGNIYNNIGTIYGSLNQFDTALQYQRLAFKAKKKNNPKDIFNTLMNIAINYRRLDKLNTTRRLYQMIYNQIKDQINNPVLAKLLNNMSDLYITQQDYVNGEKVINESLEINRRLGIKAGIAHNLNNLSVLYIRLEKYKEAEKALDEAIELSEDIKDKELELNLHVNYSILYKEMGEYQKAYQYSVLSNEINQVIFSEQLKNSIAEQETKYNLESRKKETELFRLKNVELVNSNNQILKQKEELILLNESKDAILNIVSHDLKNSVGSIVSILDLFPRTDLNEKQLKYLDMIRNSSQKALTLVKDILDANRIEMPNFELILEEMNLVDLLKEYEKDFKSLLTEKNIKVIFNYTETNLAVRLNSEKFWQIFHNLISNAIKFSKPDGDVFVLSGKEFINERLYVYVSIKDQGIGISKEKIPRLFDKFTIAGRKGTAGELSTGLGLYIVKKLVDLHQGMIEVKSSEDSGTEFKTYFPASIE